MNEEIQRRLKEIEARAGKATPGPWSVYHSLNGWHVMLPGSDRPRPFPTRETAEFMASAREDVPWLTELARELLDHLSKLEAAAQLALEALTEGMADVPAKRDKRCAELRVKAKRALREALGLAPREENDGDL